MFYFFSAYFYPKTLWTIQKWGNFYIPSFFKSLDLGIRSKKVFFSSFWLIFYPLDPDALTLSKLTSFCWEEKQVGNVGHKTVKQYNIPSICSVSHMLLFSMVLWWEEGSGYLFMGNTGTGCLNKHGKKGTGCSNKHGKKVQGVPINMGITTIFKSKTKFKNIFF